MFVWSLALSTGLLYGQTPEKRTLNKGRKNLESEGYRLNYSYQEAWIRKNLYSYFKTFGKVYLKNDYWVMRIEKDDNEVLYAVQVRGAVEASTIDQTERTEIYIGLLLDHTLAVFEDDYIESSRLLLEGFELMIEKEKLSEQLIKNEAALFSASKALSRWQKHHHNGDQTTPLILEKELIALHKTRSEIMQSLAQLYAP